MRRGDGLADFLGEGQSGLNARKQQQNWQRGQLDSHDDTEFTTGSRSLFQRFKAPCSRHKNKLKRRHNRLIEGMLGD